MLIFNIFGASGNEFLGWVRFARFAENQESGIRNPESGIRNLESGIRNPESGKNLHQTPNDSEV